MKQGGELSWNWYIGSIFLVVMSSLFLFVSVWKQIDSDVERSLVAVEDPGSVLKDVSAVEAASKTIAKHEPLPQLTFLPHHPFYMARMIYQRIVLWMTFSPLEKVKRYEQYADERMGVSVQLLAMGRGREAMEAAAKGYMYMLQAAAALKDQETEETKDLWRHLAQAAIVQEEVLLVLQESVADTLKPKVEVMAGGMERIKKEAMERGGITVGY